ncbi:MAG: acetate--CoA ligase family protein [Alphaproteobacteria bacterium]|nr:acetate--CoA ligase family protein [Alphaproteobacteria bacterium]
MASNFGALTPLLAPRSVAVIGASDREGNLGGLCVGFLRKFGFEGPVWPVNAGRSTVADLPCYPGLQALPATPDLAVIAVPAESVTAVVRDCIAAKVPAAVVWAGGFAEGDDEGRARQRELEAACRGSDIKLCGPNCIGIINTSIGLTASFSSLMTELDRFNPGVVSIVSQSGGIAVTSHARAQELGLGFRLTISCGNEATLGIPAFIDALVEDAGTRVIAVYTEGLTDPEAFAAALGKARDRGKPVVVLKGGATEASGRAALAHTGKLAGLDRTYEAIFREFAAIRVHSTEEMLDVCLHLAALRPEQLPAGNRVLLSSFGGGSGVIGTDQCAREGLVVPPLDDVIRARAKPLLTPLASTMNPIDLTPGSVTNPKNRATLPEALRVLCEAPNVDAFVFLSAGFGKLAPAVVDMAEDLRASIPKPVCISWLSPPPGVLESFAARGVRVFDEHARAIRATGHVARHAEDRRHRIRRRPELARAFAWDRHVAAGAGPRVVSEDVASGILEAAGLPVAPGRLATTTAEAVAAAEAVGFPVAIKAISPTITHRAAAGLVALHVDTAEAVARTDRAFRARAAALGARLDGLWVQHMIPGSVELLITAFRDAEFGVMVGCGMGGGATELIDDVVFARAPLDADGAGDLLGRLRTLRRLPGLVSAPQRERAADFLARFSALVASAPWPRFTFEVNPVKLGAEQCAAVDGLLVIE